MAKIAVELERALAQRERNGTPGGMTNQVLARGDGWSVTDVVCTAGPHDHVYEERHSSFSISIVAAGSFQYRAASGRELMMPGSLMLGRAGDCFECGHEHGAGDRCLSFGYAPEYFDRLLSEVGVSGDSSLRLLRVPPLRTLAPVVARASAGLIHSSHSFVPPALWEELAVRLAAQTLQVIAGRTQRLIDIPRATLAKVTRVVRIIERDPDSRLTLSHLAKEAGLSPYHFLRSFERLTGVTPHQYILRSRLREAALRLTLEPTKVLDIAYDCGFGDVSNFNRTFRAEFGYGPRAFRRLASVV